MVTLVNTHPTLLDVTKRLDFNGKIDKIAEILNQTNRVLDDAVWIEANQVTAHKTTVRTGLPAPTWRKLYGGIQPTKSTTAQITDSLGMLEAVAEVDAALAELNSNVSEFRFSEELSHIEGMSQEIASKIFNGNEGTTPEAFSGLRMRFNTIAGAPANAENIINAALAANGGSGTNTSVAGICWSMWLVGWGPNTVHCLYPKGSKAGLQMTDLGKVMSENIDGSNGRAFIYRSHYRWDAGLTVRDWRYVVRIANIERSILTKSSTSGADLIDCMSQATDLPPSLDGARFAWYANRSLVSFLRRQITNKVANSTLTMENVGGKPVMMFMGLPVRRCDALAPLEDRIVW